MTTVVLHGHLAETFGSTFDFMLDRPIDFRQALKASFPTFTTEALKCPTYSILADGEEISFDSMFQPVQVDRLEIVPIYAGNSKGGRAAIKFVAAAVLYLASGPVGGAVGGIFGAAAGTATSVAITGVANSLVLSGFATLFYKDPDQEPEDNNKFIINIRNTAGAGRRINLIYGENVIGSHVISVLTTSTSSNTYIVNTNNVVNLTATANLVGSRQHGLEGNVPCTTTRYPVYGGREGTTLHGYSTRCTSTYSDTGGGEGMGGQAESNQGGANADGFGFR